LQRGSTKGWSLKECPPKGSPIGLHKICPPKLDRRRGVPQRGSPSRVYQKGSRNGVRQAVSPCWLPHGPPKMGVPQRGPSMWVLHGGFTMCHRRGSTKRWVFPDGAFHKKVPDWGSHKRGRPRGSPVRGFPKGVPLLVFRRGSLKLAPTWQAPIGRPTTGVQQGVYHIVVHPRGVHQWVSPMGSPQVGQMLCPS
jgi:hypothetical protein